MLPKNCLTKFPEKFARGFGDIMSVVHNFLSLFTRKRLKIFFSIVVSKTQLVRKLKVTSDENYDLWKYSL